MTNTNPGTGARTRALGPQAQTEEYIHERYGHYNATLARVWKAARFEGPPVGSAGSLVDLYVYGLERDTKSQSVVLGEPALMGRPDHDRGLRAEAETVVAGALTAAGFDPERYGLTRPSTARRGGAGTEGPA